jgi:hypothetical protein
MQSRFLKQLIYAAFYLTIIFIIASTFYFISINSSKSCFDERKNQGEIGIDCGGPCEPCELRTLEEIKVSPVIIFDNEDGTLSALIGMRNPNNNFGAERFLYNLSFYGPDRALINSFTRESFIYPSEIKDIVEAALPVDPVQVVRAELEISQINWISVTDFFLPKTQIRGLNVEIDRDTEKVLISGIFVNQNSFPLSKVTINGILFSKFSAEAGVSKTAIDEIDPFEERTFRITISGIDLAILRDNLRDDVRLKVEARR